MENLNELLFFSYVVKYNGFSAASRETGIDKTRLSRSLLSLEKRVGVKLLQRSTRKIVLTEAGKVFYEHCCSVVNEANTAYTALSLMKSEPSGEIRVACPVILANSYLAEILPDYLNKYPKVSVYIEANDRPINVIGECFDIALWAAPEIEESSELVARELDIATRVMVASPSYLESHLQIHALEDLKQHDIISQIIDIKGKDAIWELNDTEGNDQKITLRPRMISNDLRMQLRSCVNSVGIGLFPINIVSTLITKGKLVQVLPQYRAKQHIIHIVYPRPNGILPSVRSLIDYLLEHLSKKINEIEVN